MKFFRKNTSKPTEVQQSELTTEEFVEARRLVKSRSSVNHATAGKAIRGLQQTALVAAQTDRDQADVWY